MLIRRRDRASGVRGRVATQHSAGSFVAVHTLPCQHCVGNPHHSLPIQR
jgi:hypothetical protein